MPSISQQDYIYIDVPSFDPGEESNFSEEAVKQLFKCAKNNTLEDVVFVQEADASVAKCRILYWVYEGADFLEIYFYSNSEGGVVSWVFSAPDTANNEAA